MNRKLRNEITEELVKLGHSRTYAELLVFGCFSKELNRAILKQVEIGKKEIGIYKEIISPLVEEIKKKEKLSEEKMVYENAELRDVLRLIVVHILTPTPA